VLFEKALFHVFCVFIPQSTTQGPTMPFLEFFKLQKLHFFGAWLRKKTLQVREGRDEGLRQNVSRFF